MYVRGILCTQAQKEQTQQSGFAIENAEADHAQHTGIGSHTYTHPSLATSSVSGAVGAARAAMMVANVWNVARMRNTWTLLQPKPAVAVHTTLRVATLPVGAASPRGTDVHMHENKGNMTVATVTASSRS